MKKLIGKILLLLIIFTNLTINVTSASTEIPPLEAQGVVLMDGTTGDILFSRNPDVQFEPASTTKIMTALVTLENVNLDDKVTIGENPPFADGSSIGILKGEVYTVKELLLGLLLESGNDTAEALAEYVAGSNSAFGALMTAKAKELGANNTIFKNPSGLHEDGHVTTAHDLALIMKAAYNNADFNEIARTPYYVFKSTPYPDGSEKWANNKNHCLNEFSSYYYEYAYSGKVGYTPEANHTYASSAVKNGQVLIASFLNAENKNNQFLSVGELFEYGFDNFETIKLVSKGDKIGEYKIDDSTIIPLVSSKDFYYSKLKSDSIPSVAFSYESKDLSEQSLTKGESLFKGNILVNNKKYVDLDFISAVDREYNLKTVLGGSIDTLKENKATIMFLCTSLVIILAIRIAKFRRYKRKKRRK